MTASMNLQPDDKVPTARNKGMKSGYGVKNTVTASGYTSAPSSHYTYGCLLYTSCFPFGMYCSLPTDIKS